VFLWRADKFGALNMADEHERVVELLRRFMVALDGAASNEYHIGLRYSGLLESLWFPSLGHTSEMIDGNAKCTTNFRTTSHPQNLEILPNAGREAYGSMLQTMGLDPFCGSFSGLEVEFLELDLQDGFNF
jgi:hypothetical protein